MYVKILFRKGHGQAWDDGGPEAFAICDQQTFEAFAPDTPDYWSDALDLVMNLGQEHRVITVDIDDALVADAFSDAVPAAS